MKEQTWPDEIFACGNLPQENSEETQEEGARLWERYVQLADNVVGDEGVAGVAALVRSLRVEEDFGAYQAALSALERFPLNVFGAGVADSAQSLAGIPECWSGNVLLMVARAKPSARSFIERFALLKPDEQLSLRRLIDFHESHEWLREDDVKGKLTSPLDHP
ncbi:hypothetical protein ACFWMX_36295 [Streptomyces sp. NPDC058378]|uniref:hypothetical protein n=1 Tax=Streptomyces sp. NPDC058378 TaxID=3346469 RepID=UPI003658E8DA